MWSVTAPPGPRRIEIQILELRAPDQPMVGESIVLTGLTAAVLPEAFHLAETGQKAQLEDVLALHLP